MGKKYADAFQYICEAARMPYPNSRGRHYPAAYRDAEEWIAEVDSHEFSVEIARKAVERHTGLSYRKERGLDG